MRTSMFILSGITDEKDKLMLESRRTTDVSKACSGSSVWLYIPSKGNPHRRFPAFHHSTSSSSIIIIVVIIKVLRNFAVSHERIALETYENKKTVVAKMRVIASFMIGSDHPWHYSLLAYRKSLRRYFFNINI